MNNQRRGGTRTAVAIIRWMPAIAWMGAIFYVSSIPASGLPGGYSQIAHFTEYAVLAALLVFAVRGGVDPIRTAALVVAFAAFYGMTDEFHQSFVPGRVPDVHDWLLDTLGAASIAVAWLISRRAARARER